MFNNDNENNGLINSHLSSDDNNEENLRQETRAIHCGQSPDQWTHRSLIPPIFNSTTFELSVQQLFDENFKEKNEYDYSRTGNPTRNCLEKALASLEFANYGLCFSSGMSATITICHLLKSGDQILCFNDIYGGTHRYFQNCLQNYGIQTQFIDFTDLEKVKSLLSTLSIQLTCKTLLWIETPSNPLMKIVDLKALNQLRNDFIPNSLIVCDNTFMSPVFQNPLKFGVDIVVHSVTKYINGHADVISGAVMTNTKQLYDKLKFLQNALGCVPSPFDCFLVNRGLKTLSLRMAKHQENGLFVAKFLETHPMVVRVLHWGLKSHPQNHLAKKQCEGFSGMISFYIKGSEKESKIFLKSLKLFKLVVSLGSVESRVELPSQMSHKSIPQQYLHSLGINDTLIRLSVGIEHYQDLINDLKQALNTTQVSYKE